MWECEEEVDYLFEELGYLLEELNGVLIEYRRTNPANISTSDQRFFNVLDQRWNNVDPTLKMKQNPTSDFQSCATLKERRDNIEQRWYNVVSTLFQHSLNVS